MQVTIYADTLIFINIFITYFLLVSAAMLCRRVIRRGRILLASFLGGAYALTILLPQPPAVLSVFLRIFVCVSLCAIACPLRDARSFLRLTGVFLLVNFLFAGALFAVQLLTGSDKLLYTGGVVYFDLHIPALLLGTIACYAVVRICVRICAGAQPTHLAALTFYQDGKSIRAHGLLDTGLQLSDPFTGKPVLLLRTDLAQKILPSDLHPFLRGETPPGETSFGEWSSRLRVFPFQSAGGSGILPAFRCARVEISLAEGKLIEKDIYVAVSDKAFTGSTYDALLPAQVHAHLLEGENRHEDSSSRSETAAAASHMAVRRRYPLHTRSADTAGAAEQKRGNRGTLPPRRRR